MRPPFDLTRLRTRYPSAYVDHARRITLPNVVECHGLTEDQMGQQTFCLELIRRRAWIEDNCLSDHVIEPMHDKTLRLVGRVFRFYDPNEAFAFRIRF